jgi:hypothetical protein
MRPSNPDVPVNKQTAIVVSPAKKEGFIFDRNAKASSMVPLPTRPFPGTVENDLTGRTVGRLTVIGYYVVRGSGTGAKGRWVVRCSCGRYEVRSARVIKSPHDEDMSRGYCYECDRTVQTRKGKRP